MRIFNKSLCHIFISTFHALKARLKDYYDLKEFIMKYFLPLITIEQALMVILKDPVAITYLPLH